MPNSKIAYGLAKKHGIDTKGMSPGEVWEALKEKGISREEAENKENEKIQKAERVYNESAASDIEPQKKSNAKSGFKKLLKNFQGKEEGTYSLETGKLISHDDGFQVSFQQSSDTYTDDEYDAKVLEMLNRTGSETYAGVFGEEPEVSFHVGSLEEAMKIAEEYNQHSIWDWAAASRGDWDKALILNKHYDPNKNIVKR